MKLEKNKKLSTILLILILAVSSSAILIGIPATKALYATSVPTNAWVAVPATDGINQQTEIVMFLTQISQDANGSGVSGPNLNIGTHFAGYMLTITAPDGTNQTMGPYTADPISNAFIFYTPTQLGTYKAQFSFPGQWINDTPRSTTAWPPTNFGVIDLYYQPSVSNVATFTVQQQPIAAYPASGLPTDYWNNPVNAMNRDWAPIVGDWLIPTGPYGSMTGASSPAADRYQPYGTSPTSGHVVWTKPITEGGQVGGNLGAVDYYTGQSYNVFFNPIIIDGTLYYNQPSSSSGNDGFYAVDLRSGQTQWFNNGTTFNTGTAGLYTYKSITLGQTLEYTTGNQMGAQAYLWAIGTRYVMLDAFTGDIVTSINNSVAGSAYAYDSQGDLLAYTVGSNYISCWNSTQCIVGSYTTTGAGLEEWSPSASLVYNWPVGVMWNTSIPAVGASLLHLDYADGVLVTYADKLNTTTPLLELTAYSTTTGAQLWQENETGLFGYLYLYTGAGAMADGVMTLSTLGDQTWYGFNLTTGAQIWKIPPSANATAWGTYDMCSDIDPSTGIMFTSSYDGNIHAYNVLTGQPLWTWQGPDAGLNTPYGTYPFGGLAGTIQMTAVDGQLYATNGEHSHVGEPMFQGYGIYDLNETTGAEIWTEHGWWQFPAFSDGYMVADNGYDNQLYGFGQGNTATTVNVVPVVNNAAQVLIKGTVTDQSPGQTCLGIPAAGTPAISDASMSQWMEYLYQEQPEPLNATGVPVTLSYIDPNGNEYTMGTTTSDITGQYSYTFTPNIPGTYRIIATFGGSNSYYSSSAETSMAFDLPATTAAPTATPTSVADLYFVPAIVGLFVLIIVGLIVLALLVLRKRS